MLKSEVGPQCGVHKNLKRLRGYNSIMYTTMYLGVWKRRRGEGERERSTLILLKGHPLSISFLQEAVYLFTCLCVSE